MARITYKFVMNDLGVSESRARDIFHQIGVKNGLAPYEARTEDHYKNYRRIMADLRRAKAEERRLNRK